MKPISKEDPMMTLLIILSAPLTSLDIGIAL